MSFPDVIAVPLSGRLLNHEQVYIGRKMTMAILKSTSRPVTFRVSSEELEALSKACISSGARSISEFARVAVWQRVRALSQEQSNLSGDLQSLSRELGDLDSSLHDVSKRIRSVLGNGGSESGGR